MARVLPLVLLLLTLLAAPVARAEEAPAPVPTVEEIAARLASADAKEREEGEVLLVRALRAASDRADLLARLAEALRARTGTRAPAAEPPPPPVPAAPTPAAPASPAPAPPAPLRPGSGTEAPGPPAPTTVPAQEAEDQTVAPATADAPAKSEPKATWTLRAWGVSVPEREVARVTPWIDQETGGKRDLRSGASFRGGPLERVTSWVEAAQQAADAENLGEATLPLAPGSAREEHLGEALLYRCCVVPVKGAWAVETRTIPAGLSLRARLEGPNVVLEPSWVTIAQPIPTERTRPAAGVDPVEIDRPDWSVSRVRLTVGVPEAPGAAILVNVPGLLPDAGRRLVLVVELKPVP